MSDWKLSERKLKSQPVAWQEGYKACHNNVQGKDNPYEHAMTDWNPKEPERSLWKSGWLFAEVEILEKK